MGLFDGFRLRPGPPPSGEPSAYTYLSDNRLLHNPSIARMPTTQREWNGFIQELNKWIKNETGNFNPTFTGFAIDPTQHTSEGPSCWWHRYGQLVHMDFVFSTGTSNATGFTITNLPEVITPRDSQVYPIIAMLDDGANVELATVEIGSDGVITFYAGTRNDAWTATGTKGFNSLTQKSVIYSLRQPGKH